MEDLEDFQWRKGASVSRRADGRRPRRPSESVATGEEEKLICGEQGGENEDEDGLAEVEDLEDF